MFFEKYPSSDTFQNKNEIDSRQYIMKDSGPLALLINMQHRQSIDTRTADKGNEIFGESLSASLPIGQNRRIFVIPDATLIHVNTLPFSSLGRSNSKSQSQSQAEGTTVDILTIIPEARQIMMAGLFLAAIQAILL